MKTKISLAVIACMLLAMLIGGCSTTPKTQTSQLDIESRFADIEKQEAIMLAEQEKLSKMEQQLEERMSLIDEKEAQIRDKEIELSQMKKEPEIKEVASLFPPNAKPGECYARIFVPSQYEYKTETVLKHEAKENVVVIPSKYKTVEEQVLVKAASSRMETIPAKFAWVKEKVLVSPEKRELLPVPAQYETIKEKILVREEHVEWKKGTGPIQKIDDNTGEIMCLVKEPAIYKTITKRVLKKHPTTKEVIIPAEHKIIKKKVMVSPPQAKLINIPARYKTVKVTKLVEPAKTKTNITPAEYQTVKHKIMVSPGHLEWQQILCKTNMTPGKITEIQQSLKTAGYNPGAIDGDIGPNTMAAVNKYQADKGLPVTKYITFEILESLDRMR